MDVPSQYKTDTLKVEKRKEKNMTDQEVQLDWNCFQNNLKDNNRSLFETKSFADITLVTEEMDTFKAHRSVLQGASTIFKQLFEMGGSNNSLLFLKGITARDLKPILEFVYLGQTRLETDNLHDFISAAVDLGVKELDNILPGNDEERTNDSETIQKSEDKDECEVLLEDEESIDDKDSLKEKSFANQSNNECGECEKSFKRKEDLNRHKLTHQPQGRYECFYCSKSYSRSDHRHRHIKKSHPNN